MREKAIWFSRHQPTAEQIADAAAMGWEITVTSEMTEMAAKSLETDADVAAVVAAIDATVSWHFSISFTGAIFGVFAAPVQAVIAARTPERTVFPVRSSHRPCYAAWNISRTPEGGRPTFTHKSWVLVGWI